MDAVKELKSISTASEDLLERIKGLSDSIDVEPRLFADLADRFDGIPGIVDELVEAIEISEEEDEVMLEKADEDELW